MNKIRLTTALRALWLAALVGTAGCSSQQFYAGGQAWRRNECQRIPDFQERKRCMDSAALSFEDYQRQSAAAGARK